MQPSDRNSQIQHVGKRDDRYNQVKFGSKATRQSREEVLGEGGRQASKQHRRKVNGNKKRKKATGCKRRRKVNGCKERKKVNDSKMGRRKRKEAAMREVNG